MDSKLPPEGISQTESQTNPSEEASKGANKDGGQKPLLGNVDLVTILDLLGGAIFGNLGFSLSDAGFHVCAYVFYFLTLLCGIAALTHYLKDNLGRYRWGVFLLLTILDFFLYFFLSWRSLSDKAQSASAPTPQLVTQTVVKVVEMAKVSVPPLEFRQKHENIILHLGSNTITLLIGPPFSSQCCVSPRAFILN